MKKKVIVIGAGPGGLACSILLANKGLDVTVYEKRQEVGGRNSFFKLGDYIFDIGPTFFLMKNILEEIFELTGRKLDKYVTLTHLDPMYKLAFKDRTLYPSSDEDKMLEDLEKNFKGSTEGYLKYMKKEQKKYDRLIPCLQVPYGKLSHFLKARFFKSLPYLDAHKSLFDVLGKYYKEDDLKIAFTFQAKYIGMSPWEAPGTFSILSFIEHGGGVYHVTGGLNKLSKAMADIVLEENGKIHTNTPVKRVIIENGKAIGIELENGNIEKADYVVLNADFGHAMTKLVSESNRKKYTNDMLKKKKYSCSTFMLYLGVNRIYDNIQHHNIFFADDYRKNVDEITKTFALSSDPSFYVQNASITDNTLAPSGKSTIYVLVPVANNFSKIDWQKEAGPFRDLVLDRLEKKAGLTDLKKHIEAEKVMTPFDWENEMDVYNGATFNLGHNISQMLYYRPHNEFEEFKNCYLVGGGTHPGSGLPTIYESGRISASLILQKEGIEL
ncbi:MAG: phytoene desaturase [Candidatus Coatesbacteria bacterium]|nr:phytoene desaturase [Candidatus Coatesbacteria bacterium]